MIKPHGGKLVNRNINLKIRDMEKGQFISFQNVVYRCYNVMSDRFCCILVNPKTGKDKKFDAKNLRSITKSQLETIKKYDPNYKITEKYAA